MPKTSTSRVIPFRPSPAKDEATGRFLPGNNGGNGRPVGARNKLAEAFIADMLADWQEHGADAITRMRQSDPSAYVRVVASLLPRHVGLDDDTCPVAGLSDSQLERLIRVLTLAGEADA